MAEQRIDILLALKTRIEGVNEARQLIGQLAGGLTATALAYKAVSIASQSSQLASQIKNLAAEANLTTDAFQALTIGGNEYGLTQENIVRGATTLRKNLEDAAKHGASPLNDYLRQLGLSAAGLQALAPERQFEAIGRSIANAADKEAAFAAGMELLGAKQAPKLLEFLRDVGTEGFEKFAKAAKSVTLTKEELDTLDRAGNAWERIGYGMKIAGARATNATVEAFSPAMSPIAAAQSKMFELEQKPRASSAFGLGLQILELNHARANFVREAIKVGGPNDLASAEDVLARMAKAGAAAKIITDFQKQIADGRATLAKVQAETAAQISKMSDASLNADLAAIEKQDRVSRATISQRDYKLLDQIKQELRKKTTEQNAQDEKEAETYKNLANPVRAYARELEKLVHLKSANLLTDQEAAAAAKILTQQLLQQAGEIGNHTRRLSELQEQRELIEGNPFLSAEQRKSKLSEILTQENAELDKQIALLRQRQNLSPEQASQLRGLVKQRTQNQFNPAGFSFGQEVGADLMGYANSFGTVAQQTSGVIRNTIGRAVDGVSRGIAGWLTGTTTWRQVLMEIGTGVLEDIIGAIIRIGVQQVINATIGKTLQAASMASTLAMTGATATAISAMMIAPATLSTIASFGGAALAAPEEILAALAMTAPMGLFYEGGHTGDGGIVHEDEWVAPNWMVDHPVFGGVIDMLETARAGGGVAPASTPSAGSNGKRDRTVVLVPDMVTARSLRRDPEWNTEFVRAGRRNRGEIAA
jgi:hypothetical protein